jgi:hypothetical protein
LGFGPGWQCPIQELPNRFADFVMMGLKRKMSSIKEVDFSIGINKNDRDLKSFVFQLLLEIETADSRKTHIDYQATGATRWLPLQKLFSCFEAFRARSGRLQQSLD